MIRLCFRFDDPSPTSNHELERTIISTFARNNVPVTVAVIPYRKVDGNSISLHPDQARHLIEAQERGAIEVAQHGFFHLKRSAAPSGAPSEFCTLAHDAQREMIEHGADHLTRIFGQRAIGFVPPWNTYDATTVSVLEQGGYRYISAGWDVPGQSRALATIPRTCWLRNLRSAVAEARRFRAFAPAVVAVLHHFDFKESGEASASITMDSLNELLSWARSEASVVFSTLGGVANKNSSFEFGARCHMWRTRLPWRFRGLLPEHCLLTHPLRRTGILRFHTGISR